MSVNISAQGRAILRACEDKVRLQGRAEALNDEAHELLERLKQISDEQHSLLQHISDIDRKIEYLAGLC